MSSRAAETLARLKTFEAVKQRRAAAVLGALLADAASTPLHWVYDRQKLLKVTEEQKCVVFYPQSVNPFYVVPTGSNSAYGDQVYVTLKSVVENGGFNGEKLQDDLFKAFGPGTINEDVRKQPGQPKRGPWTNQSVKMMIANKEDGVTPAATGGSKDPDGLCKAIILVGLLGGRGRPYDDEVVQCVETCQLNNVAKNFAVGGVRLLDHVITTGEHALANPEPVLTGIDREVVGVVKEAVSKAGEEHWKYVKEKGTACSFPATFYGAVHNANQASSYEEAVKAEILASGDNCARVIFAGAYTAARFGLNSIPEAWLEKYTYADEVLGLIEKLVSM